MLNLSQLPKLPHFTREGIKPGKEQNRTEQNRTEWNGTRSHLAIIIFSMWLAKMRLSELIYLHGRQFCDSGLGQVERERF